MGKSQKGVNDFGTWSLNNGEWGKRLKSEFTGICDDGTHYKINEVSFGSHKRFKWKCSKGHEWWATVNHRTAYRTGCPYCSKAEQSKARLQKGVNDLGTWSSNNGEFGKRLASEFTGICEDGKCYKINEVSFGSNKRFKWVCSKGHEWFAKVHDRTNCKTGCPYCNSHNGTSYPEQFIYHCLKQIYQSTENRCKVLKSQIPQGIEFDIGIPDIPLCIEYSPTCWHIDRQEQDNFKKELCKKANVRLIQIIADSYDELDHCMEDDYICFKMDRDKQDEILTQIVDHILKSLGHSISEIDLEQVKKNAWEYSRGKIEYKDSLEGRYPELAKEFHPTLNKNLNPSEIKCGSHKRVYWQCPVCDYGANGEWCTTAHNRTQYKTGCPKCGYNWYKAQNGIPQK